MFQRVHLDIQVGEHANNYAEIAAKDKLTELQLRVRQLVEQVDQIQKEQNYQRVSQRWSFACYRVAVFKAQVTTGGVFLMKQLIELCGSKVSM